VRAFLRLLIMAALPFFFDLQFYTNEGASAAGYKLHTYTSGTTTNKTTYSDAAGLVPNANPITLDSAGRAPIWFSAGKYSIELKTPGGALVKRWDDVGSPLDFISSAELNFTAAGVGAVTRTIEAKIREGASVMDYGALGDGSDATESFAKTAVAVLGGNSQAVQYPSIPSCDWAVAYIPAGSYTLTSYIDTGNREVTWLAAPGAVINGTQYLNGRLLRIGSKISDFHHGLTDSAVSFAVMANRLNDEIASVSGFSSPAQLSKGNGRDTVGMYVGNKLPAATYGAATVTSYSSTGAALSTPLTTDQLLRMRKGMVVQTRHSPQKYAGLLTAWTASTLTVSAWYLVDGSASGAPTTPTGTDGVDINVFRKAWALNANAFIDSTSYGNAINGFELGVRNEKGEPTSRSGLIESYGMYVVNLETGSSYYGDSAYVAANSWTYGYHAWGKVTHAFYYDGSTLPGGDPLSSLLFGKNAAGRAFYQINPDGSTEAGERGAASTVVYDFHTGATNVDYDSRLAASGGTGSSGGGTLGIVASAINLQAGASIDAYTVLRPSADGTLGLGQAARRWSTVYAVNGTIDTSDEREKQDIEPIPVEWLQAWGDVQWCRFRFRDAVAQKGDGARWHVGLIAQRVRDVFEARGIDPFAIGLLCWDQWEDEWREGELVTPAGERFGLRYEEALALECAYLRWARQ